MKKRVRTLDRAAPALPAQSFVPITSGIVKGVVGTVNIPTGQYTGYTSTLTSLAPLTSRYSRIMNLLEGSSTVFDVAGATLDYPRFGSIADDALALTDDFCRIGEDFGQVIEMLNNQLLAQKA